MTDEQIMQVLQRCFIVGSCSGCTGCPLKPKRQEDANCIDKLVTSTLDLIKRQQAEIDRLTKLNRELEARENTFAKSFYKKGVRDFVEKLKDGYSDFNEQHEVILYDNLVCAIDDLADEMGCGE